MNADFGVEWGVGIGFVSWLVFFVGILLLFVSRSRRGHGDAGDMD